MDRLNGKRVYITGASSGIGRACAERFAAHKCALVLAARRGDRLGMLAAALRAEHGVEVATETLDVRDRDAVRDVAARLEDAGTVPDILVNNAGLASGHCKLHEGDFEDWDKMLDTNVKGLLNVTRSILPMMVARNRGHIINIGSIAGHIVYPGGNVYNATKFAVRAIGEAMNIDLVGTAVRVSNIDPGAVETEFSEVRFHGDKARASAVYDGFRPLCAGDVADAVCYAAGTPEHVNVADMIILPTAQRSPYVVHRVKPSE